MQFHWGIGMSSSKLNNLKMALGVGGRTNKYRVMLTAGGFNQDQRLIDTLVQNVTLPGRSLNDIEVWVQGRLIVVAGDASYEGSWTLTFIDTQDHKVRRSFISWMDYIDDFNNHERYAVNAASYMGTAKVQQLSTIDNTVQVSYILFNIYPKSISDITYNDEQSELIKFDVEFKYTHWVEEGKQENEGV